MKRAKDVIKSKFMETGHPAPSSAERAEDDTACASSRPVHRRHVLRLFGLALALPPILLQPIPAAWAGNGKSDDSDKGESDGGGDSGGDGDSDGGGESDGGGGSDDGGDSEGGGDSDGGGESDGGDRKQSKPGSEESDGKLASRLTGKIASLEEIETLAAKLVPGEIVDIRLRRENGAVVYRLKIIQKSGRLTLLKIDAKTRKRLANISP